MGETWAGVPGQQRLIADGVCAVYFRVSAGPAADLPVLCAKDRPCPDHDQPAGDLGCPNCGTGPRMYGCTMLRDHPKPPAGWNTVSM